MVHAHYIQSTPASTACAAISRNAILLFVLLLIAANNALAMYRCTHDQQVSYTEFGCPTDMNSTEIHLHYAPATDAEAARARYEDDVKRLNQLQFERRQQENYYQRDLRRRQQHAEKQQRAEKAHTLRCQRYELNVRVAQRELAIATPRAYERAQLKLHYATEKAALYCKK